MNIIGDELILTNTQVSKIRKYFANGFSKTQLSEMAQLGGFLGKLLENWLKTG